ncbi:MAG: UvrB/UvrC motif-containing protein [bacterium]|nr:UvrB/UvrC motif-containing protein [bacterium]
MLCDACHKIEATIHYTEIVGGKVIKLNLCEECFKKKEFVNTPFNISELLAGLTQIGKDVSENAVKCGNCGMSFLDFKKIGKLGCSDCYSVFRTHLVPLLKTIHKSSHHIGFMNKSGLYTEGKNNAVRLETLKKSLSEAVKAEEFEQAALIRDKIKELRKKIETKNAD